jgi:acyl-CoA thioesterase-2
MAGTAGELVTLLELEQLEVDLFRGAQARTERQRVFGGQVAAQAVVAATRSVEGDFALHSLHSYFLRPGDTAVPIVYDVERIRDGRSFATRRVAARQHGRPIYYMTANFQIPEAGLEHQDRMPEVPAPEQGMPLVELARERGPEAAEHWEREWAALDIRHVGVTGRGLPDDPEHPARARLWIKVDGALSEDPTVRSSRTASTSPRPASSPPRSTTRSGSTAPFGPTGGGSTTSSRRSPAAAGASPWPGCSPSPASWSRRWPRRV